MSINIPKFHMNKRDAFILANYKTMGPTRIAKHLGMPKGSVITRWGILNNRRDQYGRHKKPDFYKLNQRTEGGRFRPGGQDTPRPTPSLPKIGMDK